MENTMQKDNEQLNAQYKNATSWFFDYHHGRKATVNIPYYEMDTVAKVRIL